MLTAVRNTRRAESSGMCSALNLGTRPQIRVTALPEDWARRSVSGWHASVFTRVQCCVEEGSHWMMCLCLR